MANEKEKIQKEKLENKLCQNNEVIQYYHE